MTINQSDLARHSHEFGDAEGKAVFQKLEETNSGGMQYHLATHSPARRRRGFNLVEAAIVLGVIGLVIGGIWAAASSLSESRKVSLAATGTLKAVDNIRKMFPGPQMYPINITQAMTNSMVYAPLIYEGVDGFDLSGTTPKSPFGDRYAAALRAHFTDPTQNYIFVRFFSLRYSECIKVMSQIWAIGSYFINYASVEGTSITLPLTLASIETACNSSLSTRFVEFRFPR